MNSITLISLLSMATVFAIMVGFYRWLGWTRAVEARLQASLKPVEAEVSNRPRLADRMTKRVSRMSFSERLERQLVAADSNMSVGEFIMIRLAAVLWAFVIGWFISRQPVAGLLLGIVGWVGPGMWLKIKQSKRAKAFSDQLPDMLSMLTGSLRAGYGLLYAISVIEKEMPEPMASEFGRVLKETALGYSLSDALDHLVERVQNDDLELVVTAVHIQSEVGGSLADVLETISRTIRERIQLKGQIQAMTSQQRITGMVLSAMPFLLGTVLFLMSPEYMGGILQPGWPLIIPIGATVMVICGNFLMGQMIKIDV
ncbi:MAG: type II secretion system F family protein [Caldilineaceae bacterium]|nr:type II secretion system F family protein [Caldilineaceae bacterium]